MLSTNAQGGITGQVPSIPIVAGTGELKRHEIDAILNNQNVFSATLRDIKIIAGELQARTDAIIQNQARAPTAQIQGGGYDVQSMIGEMRDGLNQVKIGISAVSQKYENLRLLF